MAFAIDEEGGGPVDAAADSSGKIGADAGEKGVLFDGVVELPGGKLEALSELHEERVSEGVLVLIKQIVHLPKLAVKGGEFGNFGGALRPLVKLAHGKIAENKTEAIAEVGLDSFHDWIGCTAVWALIVAILHQGALRGWIALGVIVGTHRNSQPAHDFPPLRAQLFGQILKRV
jgi:hypothetical protein